MAINIENSDIKLEDVITIVDNCIITGSNGTVFYFNRFKQYVKCSETENEYVGCDVCDPNEKQLEDYFVVCIDSEQFKVPKSKAVIEGYIRTESEQDLSKEYEKRNLYAVKKYKQFVKESLGREINTGNPDIAGQREYDRIQLEKGKTSGRLYGQPLIQESEE